ncbi:Sec-independent protein translocase protein TatA [BD1-7 clade bacterium]|uniref:Sec-independent protein translocase protein TatA n=1 Tax=BD1-7 clade bacterium TaxID=2029982 RepID=A0A5S9QCE4_9GAMM|nr:Sec-independent protein translocase protein TatA [BD1-7 clade bacterium]CAA0084108.1 Sec-independent protein translocase protein TatA [BD1-7 clade bacterium]CAA0115850.1 Sec-independent protein translocase protein TatA [BD1-7 clade bacterium]
MGFGIKELALILIIVLLLFGTKKLKNIGSDLGGAIKGFRKSINDEEEAAAAAKDIDQDDPALEKKTDANTITGEAETVKDTDKQA